MTGRSFSAGRMPLTDIFRELASQDIKRRIATCFVAVNIAAQDVAGYYTLTGTSVVLSSVLPEIVKKLPRYPVVPRCCWDGLPWSVITKARGSAVFFGRCIEAHLARGIWCVRHGG